MTKNIYQNLERQFNSKEYQYLNIFTYRSYKLFGKDYFCDVCLVKEIKKNKIFVRLQKRWFGLSKKMIADGQKEPRWITIKSYNFPHKFEFEKVRKIFNDISEGKTESIKEISSVQGTSFAVEEVKKLKEKLKKEKGKDKNNITKIIDNPELISQVKKLNDENRELRRVAFQTQLPKYRKVLKQTQKDLDSKKENHFQVLLKNNEWIFGPQYEEVIPKRKADPENQPDFILKRYDGFCDVVEIERPDKKLFTKPNKSKKSQPTADLIQAVNQAMDYVESYNQKYKALMYDDMQDGLENPIHAYYPKGIVIIGRDKDTDRKKLRQLNNFLHNIIVLTYDEFLKQAERMLNILEKRK